MMTGKQVPILIVDDHASNIEALETFLQSDAFSIHSALSGEDALKLIKETEFAAILMDVQMPGMDGFETAQNIRKTPTGHLTPILFLTGIYNDQASVKRAHSLGAVDFMNKPFDYEILESKLKIFCELYTARKKYEEQSKTFDIALSSTPNFQYIYDIDHRFTYANKPLLKFWGLTANDVIGKNHEDLGYPKHLVDYYKKQFEKVMETGEPVQGSSVSDLGNGKFHYFEFVLTPVFNKKGEIYAVSGTTQDITERTLNDRENFRNLFMQTSEIICILSGPKHIFEFVNDAHVKVLGFNATGMTVKEAQPESPRLHAILDEVYQTGKTVELNEVPVTLRGEVRHFNLTYAAKKDMHGEIDGIMVLGIELTQQVLAREKQLESQEQLKFALASANMGDWHVDLTTGKVQMSDAALGIFGYEKKYDTPDAAIDTFIHPEDREHARNVLMKTLEQRTLYQDEYRILRDSGEVRWVQLRGRAQFVDDQPKALTGIVMDVTDEKKAQEDLKRAVSVRDEFISIASHEFRTPVTALRLQTQLFSKILNGEFNATLDREKISKFIYISDRQLIQLTRLIEQMLDVSRIGTERMRYDFAEVDLSVLVKNTIQSMQAELDAKNVSVTLDAESGVIVSADHYKLEQVIANLLSNALKYGEYKPIRISVVHSPHVAVLKVSDQGMGIPEDFKDKIFEKFERAISSENISGLGLGLYIAKEIVSAHHGTISVDTEVGKGSTFTVTIPLGQ